MSGVKVTNERPARPMTDVESVTPDVDDENYDWEPDATFGIPPGTDPGDVLTWDGDSWESAPPGGSAGDIDAENVHARTDASGAGSGNVQGQLDELYGAIWGVDTVGTLSDVTSSPQTVINDSTHNGFPGLVRLDQHRVLLVYSGDGTDHENGHSICGQIGELSDTYDSVTWGAKFTILTDAEDLRCEDGVSIVDDRIVIAFRYYTGTGGDNHDPSFIICDDAPGDFTEASGWSAPIAIPLTTGSIQNYTQGHVHRLPDGDYFVGAGHDSGTHTVGIWKWPSADGLDDPSGGSFITIGTGVNDYAEIALVVLPDGLTVRAHMRTAGGTSQYKAVSTDSGDTWGSPSVLYTAEGYPVFRRLLSGLMLAVYRKSPNGDNAWRQATDDSDTTWGSETVLDTTGDHSAYAGALQITPNNILVVYAVEDAYPPAANGDIYAQWFSDSSTFGPVVSSAAEDVTFDPTGLVNTASTDVQGAIEDLDAAIAAGGGAYETDGLILVDPGTNSVDTGSPPGVTVTTKWGIDAGFPYYDSVAADAGEEAALYWDPATFHYVLIAYDF